PFLTSVPLVLEDTIDRWGPVRGFVLVEQPPADDDLPCALSLDSARGVVRPPSGHLEDGREVSRGVLDPVAGEVVERTFDYFRGPLGRLRVPGVLTAQRA